MSINPNKTKHNKNDVGMAKPTNNAARVPRDAKTTIITNAMAVSTDPSSWLTMDSTVRDWSLDGDA